MKLLPCAIVLSALVPCLAHSQSFPAKPLHIVGLVRERHLEPVTRSKGRPTDLSVLSAREREVLALVADGMSNPHIAVQLGLSEHTVKRHVANLLLKLDMPTRAAAAGLAARQLAR